MNEKLIDQQPEWRTMDKRFVRICDMADSHLLNTIRVLRGLSPVGTRHSLRPARRMMWLNAMANEAYDRGLTLDPIREGEPVHE